MPPDPQQSEDRPGKPPEGEPRKESGSSGLAMVGVGFEFTLVIAAFTAIGWWLDGKFGTDPWLMIVGLALGFVGETYKLWRVGQQYFDNG